jgi:hypothetical protein
MQTWDWSVCCSLLRPLDKVLVALYCKNQPMMLIAAIPAHLCTASIQGRQPQSTAGRRQTERPTGVRPAVTDSDMTFSCCTTASAWTRPVRHQRPKHGLTTGTAATSNHRATCSPGQGDHILRRTDMGRSPSGARRRAQRHPVPTDSVTRKVTPLRFYLPRSRRARHDRTTTAGRPAARPRSEWAFQQKSSLAGAVGTDQARTSSRTGLHAANRQQIGVSNMGHCYGMGASDVWVTDGHWIQLRCFQVSLARLTCSFGHIEQAAPASVVHRDGRSRTTIEDNLSSLPATRMSAPPGTAVGDSGIHRRLRTVEEGVCKQRCLFDTLCLEAGRCSYSSGWQHGGSRWHHIQRRTLLATGR